MTVIVEVARSGKCWMGVESGSSQLHCQMDALCEIMGGAKDNSMANQVPLARRVRGASMVVD